MEFNRRRGKAEEKRHPASGFSLLEIAVVLALTITVSLISVVSLVPVINQQHVNNAYNTAMAAMRLARDNAAAQRTAYSVTFFNSSVPNSIFVQPTVVFQGDQSSVSYVLPPDVTFQALPALASAPPPDGYGSGTAAIDFGYQAPAATGGGQTQIIFCPDGSAQNSSGGGSCLGMNNWSGGVIYLARGSDPLSSRALTLWGGTGRIHGWRLYANGGGYQWLRQ